MENKMLARRQTKRKIIALQTVMRSQGISAEQKKALEANYQQLRNNLNEMTATLNVEEVQKRREFVTKNRGLLDIFNAFWLTFMYYTGDDGCLTKEGHGKFNHGIQIALVGYHGFDEVQANIDADWKNDSSLFGPLNKQGFFDLLFETIETWTEIVDPTYYSAFAWSLFDSIADVTTHPPRLKPIREVKCITKMQNEAAMIKKYIANKKLRMSLALEVDAMERVPDVQNRLRARKHGSNFNDKVTNMIEVLAHQYSAGTGNDDDVSLSSAMSNNSLPSLHKDDHNHATITGGIALTDEIDDVEFSSCASPVIEKTQTGPAKNISFMDYIRKKRNALVVLNNSIDGLTSADGSILFGFAQNYSDMESAANNTDVLSISSTGTSKSQRSELSWASNNDNFDLSRDPHPDDNNNNSAARQESIENYELLQQGDYNLDSLNNDDNQDLDFSEFVASGQKYGKDGNMHVSTTQGGSRLGMYPNHLRGGIRTGGYQYKAIDINEVNRQLKLRGTAIPTAEHCLYPRRKSSSPKEKEILAKNFPNITDEGGDDLSFSTAASSFQVPSINSRDIPRETLSFPTSSLVLDKEHKVKSKPKKRNANFLNISGNNLKTKSDMKESSLYTHKSIPSGTTSKSTTLKRPASGLDVASLNIPIATPRSPKRTQSVDSDGEMTESVKQMNAYYDEYSKHLQINIENSFLQTETRRKSVQLIPIFTNERVPTPLTRPLSGTSPIATSRPISPAMKYLTDKYSQSFPHGKFADVLENAQAIRNQPPSSPIWNHTRASKALKVAAAPLINAKAMEIISKPMTIYDNIKVMNEMNEVLKSKSRAQSPIGSPIIQVDEPFKKPSLVSAMSEGPMGVLPKLMPNAPAPSKVPDLAIGDIPTIAMNAIIKGLINKQLREKQRTPQKTRDATIIPSPDIDNNTARESATSSYRSISQGGADVGDFDDESIFSKEEGLESGLNVPKGMKQSTSSLGEHSQLSEPPPAGFVDTHLGMPVFIENNMSRSLIDAYNDAAIYHTVSRGGGEHPLNGNSLTSLQGNSIYSLKSTQSHHRGSIASKHDFIGNAASIAAVEGLLQSSFMKSKLSEKLSHSFSSPEPSLKVGSRDPSPIKVRAEMSDSYDELDLNTLGASTPHGSTYLTEVEGVIARESQGSPEDPVRVPSIVDEVESQIDVSVVPSSQEPDVKQIIVENVEKGEKVDFVKKNQTRPTSSRPKSATNAYTKIKTLQVPNPNTVESDSHPFITFKGTAPNSIVASGSVSPSNSQQGKRFEIKTLPHIYQHNSNFNYDSLETDSRTLDSDHVSLSESMNHIYAVQAAHMHMSPTHIFGADPAAGLIQSLTALEMSHSPVKSSDVSIATPKPMALRAAKPKKKVEKRINTSHYKLDKSHNHGLLQRTGSQTIPWLPRGTLVPPDHDRSNHLLGWKEKNALEKAFPVDNSKLITTVKSQSAIRTAFEDYTRSVSGSNLTDYDD